MTDRDGYYCRATQEDDMGQLYLSNIDFLKNGVPASIVATAVSDIRLDVTRRANFKFLRRSLLPLDISSCWPLGKFFCCALPLFLRRLIVVCRLWYADSEIPLHLYPICYYIPIFRAHLLGVELLLVIALVYLIHSVFNLFVAHGVSIGSVHYGKKYRRQSESVQRTSKALSGVIMVWSMEQTQTKARKDY